MESVKMKEEQKKKALMIIVGVIALIWLASYVFYQSKFWFGLAGVATIPSLLIAFLIENDVF